MSIQNYANVKKRFDDLISHYGLNGYNGLAAHVSIPYQTLMAWKKRDHIADLIPFVDNCPEVNRGWLQTGEGEMLRTGTGGEEFNLDELDKRILAQVQGLTPDQKRTVEDLVSDYKLVQELKQERAGKKAA